MKSAAPNKGSIRIVDPTATCPAGWSSVDWAGGPAQDLIVIQRSEFDMTESYFETTVDWEVLVSGGADLIFDPTNSIIIMDTEQPPYTHGSVIVRGRRSASISDGTLVFKSRVPDAYAEPFAVYGDAQPRGLVSGTDRNNAIEFINVASAGAQQVGCRTVSAGAATQTIVDIGQSVRLPAVYEIVAKATEVKFYVNGALVCTHTTNIPTTPLNIYYGTDDGGFGNVPVVVDWVSFERRSA